MSSTAIKEAATYESPNTAKAGKYLTFVLGTEEYGLEILKVMEIIKIIDIVPIPNVPEYIKGVINLRGKVYPIIDLRLKFGMPAKEYDKETCIIVVNLKDFLMGILVDTVSEVLDVTEEQIEPPPNFGSSVDTNFILGMGKIEKDVKILLDIDKVLKTDQIEILKTSTELAAKTEEVAA